MRMPVTLRIYLSVSALLIAAIFLIRSLINGPIFIIDIKTAISFSIGVLPIAILNTGNRYRYLCLVFTMAGIAGLLIFAKDNFGCFQRIVASGTQSCPFQSILTQAAFSNICYIVYLALGLILLRQVSGPKQGSSV